MSEAVPTDSAIPANMLTIPDVAKRFGCKPITVRRWLAKGFFPNRKRGVPGGWTWIPESDVVAHEEANRPKVLRRRVAA